MKILISYYSRTGNTERVAKDLATKLGADLEKIVDQKKRNGILGYLGAGRDAMGKRLTTIGNTEKKAADYDLVILGMPVWGWNLTPALRTYLEENKNSIKDYAFMVTSSNTPSEKLLKYFVEIMGREPKNHVGFSADELKNQEVYQKKMADFLAIFG